MHDPMTVICDLPLPWKHKTRNVDGKVISSYWATWGTLWHVDPETDGSDDSCNWFSPGLEEEHIKLVNEIVDWEQKYPFYFNRPSYVIDPEYQYNSVGPGDTAMLVLSLWQTFAWRLYQKHLTPELVTKALTLGANPMDNFCSSFACNSHGHRDVKEQQNRTIRLVMRAYLRAIRPWYKHPRWHVRHWQLQVFFIQHLKRWLFSRCAVCRKGFKYGESPCSGWNSEGPRWFKSEYVWHTTCKSPGEV